MYKLAGILPSNINDIWPVIELKIQIACQYNGNRYNADDCLRELLSGEKQLWLAIDKTIDGIAISQIIPFPRMKCCSIDICTGIGLEQWKSLLPQIEDWARKLHCSQMFFISRPGMEKALKDQGYKKTHVFLEKDL